MRRLALVVGAGALVLLAAPRAGAHALLERAEPADGASLQAPPSAVTLSFTEAPDLDLSRIDVLDTSGTNYQTGTPSTVNGDRETLRVPLEPLRKGVYTVSWRVVSRIDGHLTAGAYAFGVRVSPNEIDEAAADATATSAPDLSGAEVAGRVVLYIGLILLVGGSWIYGFAFASQPRRATSFMLAGATIAAAGLVVFAFAQQRSAGVPFGRLLDTPIGSALMQRTIGIVVALAGVVVGATITRYRRIAWDVAGVAAAAVFFVHVVAGHAAAGGLVVPKVLSQFVHMTAVGVWIGGLAALLIGMRDVEPDERVRAVRRFSFVAGFALLVVTVTGVERAVQEVRSWSALVSTGYGRIVLGKAAGLGVLAAFGALNRYRNVARADRDPALLVRTSRVELSTSVVVLVLAGLLASLAPAKSQAAEPASSVVARGSDFTREVSVRLEITPGQGGVNRFVAEVDVERGADVRGVDIKLTPASGDIEPSRIELERDDGRWVTRSAAIGTPGRWRAVVTVDRGADSVEIPLAFHTACPAPTTQEVDELRLHTIELGGRSVQAYVDPAAAGNNEVHFTLFDAKGSELALVGEGEITGSRGERAVELDVRKLSPGHVVAGGRLSSGGWVFDFLGETEGGEAVNVCFEEAIR